MPARGLQLKCLPVCVGNNKGTVSSDGHTHPPAGGGFPVLHIIPQYAPIALALTPTPLQVCRSEACEALPGGASAHGTAREGEGGGVSGRVCGEGIWIALDSATVSLL